MLGPLLFLININDLPNVSKLLSFFLFADDTNIYFETENITKLQCKINKELLKVKPWLEVNKLALIIEKKQPMLYFTSKERNCQSISLSNLVRILLPDLDNM